MVNAWSLLWEEMNGTMDETYPVKSKYVDDPDPDFKVGKSNYDLLADDPYPVVGSVDVPLSSDGVVPGIISASGCLLTNT